MKKQEPGFFDEAERLARISELGDPLEKLNRSIHWELFAPLLDKALAKEPKGPGGCPHFDYIMMFKILILIEYFGLSDEQAEFQITDRFSFMRFLGLRTSDKVPDQNTIWNFREQLKPGDIVKQLFDRFHHQLKSLGMIVNKGKIIDANIVEVPIQRNSQEENKELQAGRTPSEWKSEPSKLSHKDTDARWSRKNGEDYYGYKNTIKIDRKKKFIDTYTVCDAATHDSIAGKKVLSKGDEGQPLYGDGAFTGEPFEQVVARCGMKNRIHEKGYRGHPLTKRQKERNKAKSKVRARVEHVFGFLHQVTGGIFIRTVGLARATIKIGLQNLTYNLFRFAWYDNLVGAK
jgi:transposase, IS5 family